MRRREFLIRGVGIAAAAVLHRTVRGGSAPREIGEAGAHLAIGRGADHRCLLRRAVEALGGPPLLSRPGEHVLLKPTLAWNRAPVQGANVQPEILRAAIELALEGGASRITICDRTSLRAATVHRIAGADRVVRSFGDARVRLLQLGEKDFVPLDQAARARGVRRFEEEARVLGAALEAIQVCRPVLEADRIVNLATLRHHPTRRVALGFSNLLGLASGWPSSSTWGPRQDADLALIAAAVRPELTILDATRPILAHGPAGRVPADVGRWDELAVSRHPLAVEAWGARRFGLAPGDLPYLEIAELLGLGKFEDAVHPRVIEV